MRNWQRNKVPHGAERQSRTMSAIEVTTNVIVGFALALVTQFTIFPMFGLAVTVTNNLVIGSIFTAVSMVRSFTLRRLFEAVRARGHAVVTDRSSS